MSEPQSEPSQSEPNPEYEAFSAWFRALPEHEKFGRERMKDGWMARAASSPVPQPVGQEAQAIAAPTGSPMEQERDAARYRWLREQPYIDIGMAWFVPMHKEEELTPEAMDVAIDSAMKATPQATPRETK